MARNKTTAEAVKDTVAGIWFKRPWNTERKKNWPAELRSADGILRTPQLAITSNVSEAVRRILIACGAEEGISVQVLGADAQPLADGPIAEAALDTFNGQFALDVQAAMDAAVAGEKDKETGEYTTEPVTDPAEIQAVADAFRARPNQRRMGETSGGVKEAAKLGRQLKEKAAAATPEQLAVLKEMGLI